MIGRAGPGGGAPAGATVALAAALGVAGDGLLRTGIPGPGLAVWVALLGVAATALVRSRGWRWASATAGWSGVAVLAAAGTAWRASPALQLLFLGVVAVSASAVLLAARGRALGRTRVRDHVRGLVLVPWVGLLGALELLGGVRPPDGVERRRTLALGRGVLLAIPPVAVFGALFVAADPTFERMVVRATAGLDGALSHAVVALGFAWVAAGLLRGVFPARSESPLDGPLPLRLGIEETAVVLGFVAVLFAVFLGVQASYLFGGLAGPDAGVGAAGMTLAEYARRGFFELVVAAGLVLGLLLAVDAAVPGGAGRWVFRALAGVLIALVGAVIVSAATRLRLYVLEYGLTTDRVYAAAAMTWIAVTLALFAGTVVRGRPRRFASGALLSGVVAVFALAALNPEARVAATNLSRSSDRPVDTAYLTRLGDDAVPTILAGLDRLDATARCEVVTTLKARRTARAARSTRPDWRTWNAGSAAARSALGRVSCPRPGGR